MLRSNVHLIQNSLLKLSGNRPEIPGRDKAHIASTSAYIIRNEAYEPYLAHAINSASAIGIDFSLEYSNYDDSLQFVQIPSSVEFVIIWLNWERISENSLSFFFTTGSVFSTLASNANVYLVLPSEFGSLNCNSFASKLDKIGWPSHRRIKGENSIGVINKRLRHGYSREELDSISSKIGLSVASKTHTLKIRAIIIDLDNTLYHGVFGEDLDDEVFLDTFHLLLHSELKRLRDNGVLLCIASKNNDSDIEDILKSRLMPILGKSDFVLISGGWESKSKSVEGILRDLNFDEKYVVFIDDNERELIEVGQIFPDLLCINAEDPEITLKSLATFIEFEFSSGSTVIAERTADIRGNQVRANLRKSDQTSDQLLYEFETKIVSTKAHSVFEIERANEMFRKTNQFNCTLKRIEVDTHVDSSSNSGIILSSLRDKISDSGLIAAIHYTPKDSKIELDEFVISCRALGRDVEKYLLASMLRTLDIDFSSIVITINSNPGTKNEPALKFVKRYFIESGGISVLDVLKLESETSEWYRRFCE